jgi:hypothetical protein
MVNATEPHRVIKHLTKPMLNFKSFRSARKVWAGIELMHLIRKGQMITFGKEIKCLLQSNFTRWQDKSTQLLRIGILTRPKYAFL